MSCISPERGARLARREERAYWAYASDEQRRQTGCPARELCETSRIQGTSALDTAASLSTFAERGRVVREIGESTLRELLVYDYRMLYRVHEDPVVIRAFLHGARDFSTWRREEAPEI